MIIIICKFVHVSLDWLCFLLPCIVDWLKFQFCLVVNRFLTKIVIKSTVTSTFNKLNDKTFSVNFSF